MGGLEEVPFDDLPRQVTVKLVAECKPLVRPLIWIVPGPRAAPIGIVMVAEWLPAASVRFDPSANG